jgi:hypothetical protein
MVAVDGGCGWWVRSVGRTRVDMDTGGAATAVYVDSAQMRIQYLLDVVVENTEACMGEEG